VTVLYSKYFDLPLSQNVFHEYIKNFPADIKEKITRYRRWEDAHACMYGKLLLKKALVDFKLNCKLEDLKYSRNQRPYFDRSDFDFNISHSGNFIVCIVSNEMRLGIDVEEKKNIEIDDFESHFHKDEWDKIINSADVISSFYKYWTRKEALVKADGAGLSDSLKNIDLSKSSQQVIFNERTWLLREVVLAPGYKCSIASSQPIKTLKRVRVAN
jgi:4'-phosphopantetheinyl transferase